jgi:phenylacetaldehyde dehydrogenase
MKVIQEEIFGPVVCALPFKDDDLDAIAKHANASIYPLINQWARRWHRWLIL